MVLIGSSIVTVYVLNALNELFLAKLSSFIRIVVFIGVSAIATGSLVHFFADLRLRAYVRSDPFEE